MEVDKVQGNRKRDRDKNNNDSPVAQSPKQKKLVLEDLIGMQEGELDEMLTVGETGLHLDAGAAAKLVECVQKLVSLAKGVISGTSSLVMDSVREERRLRSLVITIPRDSQPPKPNVTAEERATQEVGEELKQTMHIRAMLKFLDVKEAPSTLYRMNDYLWKMVMPSRASWSKILRTKHKLKDTKWSKIFIRESLTFEDRQKLHSLRNQRDYLNSLGGPHIWQLRGDILVWKSDTATDRTQLALQTPIPNGWINPKFPPRANHTPPSHTPATGSNSLPIGGN